MKFFSKIIEKLTSFLAPMEQIEIVPCVAELAVILAIIVRAASSTPTQISNTEAYLNGIAKFY